MNNKVEIISYKHNGGLHRVWQYAYIVRQTSNMIVLVNDYPNVIDGDGRRWRTKEPAVCYFFKDHWYNIVCMLRPTGITYYCNLSSPYVKDSEGVKYIDYDLDVIRTSQGDIKVLDENEYALHKMIMNYPLDLQDVLIKELERVKVLAREGVFPFDSEKIIEFYNDYLNRTQVGEYHGNNCSGSHCRR